MENNDYTLTDSDFETLFKALEQWPEKDRMHNAIGNMIMDIASSDAPEHVQRKLQQEKENREIEEMAKYSATKDECRTIAFKLHALKLSINQNKTS